MTVKIESADSIPNLHSIISASDGVITFNHFNAFLHAAAIFYEAIAKSRDIHIIRLGWWTWARF